jgi:hypothetical protein
VDSNTERQKANIIREHHEREDKVCRKDSNDRRRNPILRVSLCLSSLDVVRVEFPKPLEDPKNIDERRLDWNR